jgi:hypothetical protein
VATTRGRRTGFDIAGRVKTIHFKIINDQAGVARPAVAVTLKIIPVIRLCPGGFS